MNYNLISLIVISSFSVTNAFCAAAQDEKGPRNSSQACLEQARFPIEMLQTLQVEPNISNDIDMDPCKAGSFIEDIAQPTPEYEEDRKTFYELRRKKMKSPAWPYPKSGNARPAHLNLTRERRAATAVSERIWDHGVIPYEIEEGNFTGMHKALFKRAMRHWENFTCVQFVERTEEHPNWIVFTDRPCGCCSFVGKRGNGPQAISIGKNCDKFGIVVHELGHVVGFWHEHTRPDRDEWVQIYRDSIMSGQEYNFNQLTEKEVNSMGHKYDYDSIMHYARNTFSKGTYLDTILPRDDLPENAENLPEIGQRMRLSLGDIAQTMDLYSCPSIHHIDYASTERFFCKNQSIASLSAIAKILRYENQMFVAQVWHHWMKRCFQGDRCVWRIISTHGENIVLNVTSLDIPPSNGCQTNYLEIRDGYWSRSELLGNDPILHLTMELYHHIWFLLARLCGNVIPTEPIVSSGSRLLLTYHTSTNALPHNGFTISYEEFLLIAIKPSHVATQEEETKNDILKRAVSAVCGGDLIMDEGELESPYYPEHYQPNKECIWKITVPEGFQVALKFQSFEIELHDTCTYDYLEIRDGNNEHSTLIGSYCGYKMPADIQSTSNQLYIKFFSDSSVQKAGFAASFMKEYDECSSPDAHGCEHDCINTLGGFTCQCKIGYELHSDEKRCEDTCGGFIDMANGTITSPSFPDLYPANKKCIWEIMAKPQWRITVNFTHFEIEGNNENCEYDSLSLSSKMGDGEMRKHGLFCGSRLPPVITSEGNLLRLEFVSDNSVQKTGFGAIFFTGKNVHLSFTTFEMEDELECGYDFVEVFSGYDDAGPPYGRFCGNQVPPEIVSADEALLLRFKSDDTINSKGFSALFVIIDTSENFNYEDYKETSSI
eukprot:TCALIF_04726-PA protein Name:"Similar to tll2 Tolloid-like protein 2 (Xenopus laevis)" AED:0.21 eAED:0.21 QI:19/0/0/0.86/0.78/0.73/15/0/884